MEMLLEVRTQLELEMHFLLIVAESFGVKKKFESFV
jgi:hypothetical protein